MRIRYKAALSLVALLLMVVAQTGVVDRIGMHYTEVGFKRALVTFAVARGLNGVISVAQGTELAVQPAGVGINFTPGEILDPVNDLVERFSWVMLASTTSMGLQRVLLQLFTTPGLTLLLGLALGVAVILMWRRGIGWDGVSRFAWRAALLLLLLRFAVPVMALGSELLFSSFLQPQYQSATTIIEKSRDEIGRINRGHTGEVLPRESSLLGRAKELYRNTMERIDLDATLEQYQQAAASVSEQLIQLIVIFVLQTVILPLLFLWGLVRLMRLVVVMPQPR